MKLAHLADCHLGIRQYQRATPTGANARETDVANAFRAAVDGIVGARPDIVLIAGDLFHDVKPGNTAVLFAFDQLERLRAAGIPVVAVAGNHETPRTAEAGCILPLFERCGVRVAVFDAREFVFPALDLRVVAAPHTAVMRGEVPLPSGPHRYQVLVAHAEVSGGYGGDRPCGQLSAEVIGASWSYAALGDYHVCHEVGLMAWYAGATEYTSSNPWSEIVAEGGQGKSWLLIDLDTGTVLRQPLPQGRSFHDLGVLDARGMTPPEVNAALLDMLGSVDLAGAVARLRVKNIPRHLSRELDHQTIREEKARALHLKIEYTPPDKVAATGGTVAEPRPRVPLDQMVADFLGTWELQPGLDRERFVTMGRDLMAEVSQDELDQKARKGAA